MSDIFYNLLAPLIIYIFNYFFLKKNSEGTNKKIKLSENDDDGKYYYYFFIQGYIYYVCII